ncbi:hypothetical protein P5V15_013388 [Pogonomyrmex californicus]
MAKDTRNDDVHSLPPNIDWNALRNDPDSIAQNEKILQLFLQLAMRTANRLTRLKKEIEKKDSCSKHNDNLSSSTSEVFVTQLPSQENLDRLDENQEIQNHLSSGDSEIKDNQTLLENSDQNQTASDQQLQESFDSSTQNINRDGDIASTLDSKTSNLIQESVEDVQDTLSNVTGHSNESINFDTLQTPSLDLSTTSNSLNANESGADVRDLRPVEDGISQRLFNPIELGKNIANTSVINDLTKTVNKFFPELEKLQKSPLGINQSTGLIQSVPKIISDVQKNVNRHIPQLHNALSGTIDGISQKFLDPSIIKNFESILSPQIMNNFPVVNQILSSTRNFAELMFKILPMAIKTTNNLLNQIVSESQNIHEMFNITEENNQEIKTSNLSTNVDNSAIDDSNNVPALLNDRKDSSIPLFRSFPDFNQHENNKSETDLSFTQTNENANRFIDKKLLIKSNETDHHAGQIDEEIRDEEFKKINETETDDRDKQLNTFSENLSNKNGENELKEIATSPNQLESALTEIPITEVKSSNDTQDLQNSENADDIVKSNVEETRRPQEDSLSNSERNQISHIINNLSELSDYRSVIDNLKKENLHEQLSEAKLQEIDVRLINALWPIIEKRMSGNASDYVTDYYNEQKNKNFPSNISSDSRQTIDEQGSNHVLYSDELFSQEKELDKITRRALTRDAPTINILDEEIMTRDIVADMMVSLKMFLSKEIKSEIDETDTPNRRSLHRPIATNDDYVTIRIKIRKKDIVDALH